MPIFEVEGRVGRALEQQVRLSPRLSPGGCGHAL
jgi:hypothetical protein